MSDVRGLHEWEESVSQHFPTLSKPQAAVLAMLSFGMVLARSCAQTAVVCCLASLLGAKPDTLRQRLREFCYDAEDKHGDQRVALVVEECFEPLLRWVMALWSGNQLALAVDATTLGSRFTVLAVSVLYRGCAIPVAWTVLPGNEKKAWREGWLRMLRLLGPAVPPQMTVIVLADRGLYARWLFRRIVRLGWHPFLRVNTRCHFRPQGAQAYAPLREFAPMVGTHWSGEGTAFKCKGSSLDCTLLACWGEGHEDAWFVLTDLAPDQAQVHWYALRAWIEHGFKVTKRGGWQWNRTRMLDPNRASRLWLAVAVATLWTVSVGGQCEADSAQGIEAALSVVYESGRRRRKATQARLVSVFRQGWTAIMMALVRGETLKPGRLIPEPWPQTLPLAKAKVHAEPQFAMAA